MLREFVHNISSKFQGTVSHLSSWIIIANPSVHTKTINSTKRNCGVVFSNYTISCKRSAATLNMSFQNEKEKFLNMNLEEKRAQYRSKNYVTLDEIKDLYDIKKKNISSDESKYKKIDIINDKISIFHGDITSLEVDAIVNAANSSLRGGGGVDGAIHRAAGKTLLAECSTIGFCQTGDAVITGGYKLPAKYVIHTVGPVGEKPDLLRSCYEKSLKIAMENGCKSVAFPCISTGVYGYPNESAAHIALETVRKFLEKHQDKFSKIIFCLFLPVDITIYEKLIPVYFPE